MPEGILKEMMNPMDRQKLENVLSGMPCDNLDDPREVAQNEMFAEQADIELGIWASRAAKTPSV
jgi:hypothetical protein